MSELSSEPPFLGLLAPPRERRFLQAVSCLLFGTSLHLRRVYPANVLIVVLMLTCCACAGATIVCGWYFYHLQKLKDFGAKAVVGVSLRLSCEYIVLLLVSASLIQSTILVYRAAAGAGKSSLIRAHPARFMLPRGLFNAPMLAEVNSSVKISSCFDVASLVTGMSILSGLIFFALLLWKTLHQHDEMYFAQNPCSRKYGLRSLSYIFGVFSTPFLGVWLSVFYAAADDLVAMCDDLRKHLTEVCACSAYAQNEGVQSAVSQSHREVRTEENGAAIPGEYQYILSTFEDLKTYMDRSVSLTRLWLSFHLILTFVGFLLFALSSLTFLFLSTSTNGKFQYPIEDYSDLYWAALVLCCYIFPLHAAARVNRSWDALVRGVLMNPALIRRFPREYLSISSYLTGMQGGFRVLGHRVVEHAAGLKAITILFTLAGLARTL